VRSTASFSMSTSGTAVYRRPTSALILRRFRGSGAASSGVSLIAQAGRSAISSQSRPGSSPSSAASDSSISRCSLPMNSDGSRGLRRLS
jgi:hypothetical protein